MNAYWSFTDHEDKNFVAIRLNGDKDFTSACSVTAKDLFCGRIVRADGRAEILLANGDCVFTSRVLSETVDYRGLVLETLNRHYVGK